VGGAGPGAARPGVGAVGRETAGENPYVPPVPVAQDDISERYQRKAIAEMNELGA
jgi:hypothetical protein